MSTPGIRTARQALLLPVLALVTAGATFASELTFEHRVEAQRAIERVYYSHQIGATLPFDQAVPRELIERKVRTYLKQSVALEKLWHMPVTADALAGEVERIARQTRMPERLRELYTALGDDPALIQECLGRPVLVGRLIRGLFDADSAIHAGARREAETLRGRLVSGALNLRDAEPHRSVSRIVRRATSSSGALTAAGGGSSIEVPPDQFFQWRQRAPGGVAEIGPIVEEPEAFVIRVLLDEGADAITIATYSVAKAGWDLWWATVTDAIDETEARTVASGPIPFPAAAGESSSPTVSCPPPDSWSDAINTSAGEPTPRYGHRAVWTGSVMIVWGGFDGAYANTGGRYDPGTDSWTPTSTLSAPASRVGHAAIWTGSRMVIWGGANNGAAVGTGGLYDPATDTWVATSAGNAPSARDGFTAVWSGNRMIVWGGRSCDPSFNCTHFDSGGIYDPASDTWGATSGSSSPSARSDHAAVWTGTEMIVWGGTDGTSWFNTGSRYNPTMNSWTATPILNAPTERASAISTWTGTEMIVWGGSQGTGYFDTGGRFNPNNGKWNATSTIGSPSLGFGHAAVWTGSRMIVWGGVDSSTGAAYDPVHNSWVATATTNAPSPRTWHTAVWSGSRMIVWGGEFNHDTLMSAGGRYDPASNSWVQSFTTFPTGRRGHSAIWTGNVMVLWGGWNGAYLNSGSRFDPVMNTWTPTSMVGAPSARTGHAAVWTGSLMVIWGASQDGTPSGGRYNPVTDSWSPTRITGGGIPLGSAPIPAVWAGSSMIVWGGGGSYNSNGGSRYDPVADTWTPTTTVGAPAARHGHTAIWTGSRMLIWGGDAICPLCSPTDTGGLYDPVMDSWTPTTTAGAPSPRRLHTAIWTGSAMIVWGGQDNFGPWTNSGGTYTLSTSSWVATSLIGAPAARVFHTAVWTGEEMVIWGGQGFMTGASGGRYDSETNSWAAASTATAPSPRYVHTAVWTGSEMIVWGGTPPGASAAEFINYLGTGGEYTQAPSVDADTDGFGVCHGDCDDAEPAVHPGAVQICDGLNNDCRDPSWPSLTGTNEFDNDGDGLSSCQSDCDDTNASVLGPPRSIGGLDVEDVPGGIRMSWTSQAPTAGGGTQYDAYSGLVTSMSSTGSLAAGSCLADNMNSVTLDYTGADPPARNARYFMLRGQNACPGGTGTYGTPNRDMQVSTSVNPCD